MHNSRIGCCPAHRMVKQRGDHAAAAGSESNQLHMVLDPIVGTHLYPEEVKIEGQLRGTRDDDLETIDSIPHPTDCLIARCLEVEVTSTWLMW
jgi:hypothetical protein